jgi:hypothetical protein
MKKYIFPKPHDIQN